MSEGQRTGVRAIDAVLFDLDDTLLDRRRTLDRWLAALSARAGLPPADAAACRARFHGIDGSGYTSRAIVFERMSAEFPALGPADAFGRDFLEHAWSACEYVDGARDALAWCRRRGLATAVVTNGASAVQRAKLRSLGLEALVDAVCISDEAGVAKPAAEAFHGAARRLGVEPSRCAFVGDHPRTDVEGARQAGMLAVWLERDLAWPAELPRPARAIATLAELAGALGDASG